MRTLHMLLALLCVALSACTQYPTSLQPTGFAWYGRDQVSKSEQYMVLAQAGDPEFQNLIGFMLFFGEHLPMNRLEAHFWFHQSADQGHTTAQRNLAIMHMIGIGVPKDLEQAEFYANAAGTIDLHDLVERIHSSIRGGEQKSGHDDRFADQGQERGESTYATFCAGCHGLHGIAAYVGSPSFALGDRMEKPDAVLLDSIRNGKGMMPGWGNKFSAERLVEVFAFIRTLERRYQNGIAQTLRGPPGIYFLFGPMEKDHLAYRSWF